MTQYKELRDLPEDIQDYVRKLDQPDDESWIRKPIPALGHRSVLDVINDPDGVGRVREFLVRAAGKFG